MNQLVPQRDRILQAEMDRQERNDRLRKQFAQHANMLGQWIEQKLDYISNLGMKRATTLEDHHEALIKLDKEVAANKNKMEELESFNQEVQEAMIFENKHTPYTMEVGPYDFSLNLT